MSYCFSHIYKRITMFVQKTWMDRVEGRKNVGVERAKEDYINFILIVYVTIKTFEVSCK